MKYFYDTEFLENGVTTRLISIGMVSEDGREFYGENVDAPWYDIAEHQWLMDNVVPHLSDQAKELLPRPGGKRSTVPNGDWGPVMTKPQIGRNILHLIGNDPYPQLWAYYPAYDHVALMQIWGRMMDRPKPLPMRTRDLMDLIEDRGIPKTEVPVQESAEHNALADARWNKATFEWVMEQNTVREL